MFTGISCNKGNISEFIGKSLTIIGVLVRCIHGEYDVLLVLAGDRCLWFGSVVGAFRLKDVLVDVNIDKDILGSFSLRRPKVGITILLTDKIIDQFVSPSLAWNHKNNTFWFDGGKMIKMKNMARFNEFCRQFNEIKKQEMEAFYELQRCLREKKSVLPREITELVHKYI
jgi:hypothetical protein